MRRLLAVLQTDRGWWWAPWAFPSLRASARAGLGRGSPRGLTGSDGSSPQARLAALADQWQFLVQKSAEKSQKLKEANKQQNFNTGIKDFDFWLSEVMPSLASHSQRISGHWDIRTVSNTQKKQGLRRWHSADAPFNRNLHHQMWVVCCKGLISRGIACLETRELIFYGNWTVGHPLAQGMQIEEVRGSVCVAGSTNESMPREKPALVKIHKVQKI